MKGKTRVIRAQKQWDFFMQRLEFDWAEKKGMPYPLNTFDQQQWRSEMFQNLRFSELKEILNDESNRPKLQHNRVWPRHSMPYGAKSIGCAYETQGIPMEKTMAGVYHGTTGHTAIYFAGEPGRGTVKTPDVKTQILNGERYRFRGAVMQIHLDPGYIRKYYIRENELPNAQIIVGGEQERLRAFLIATEVAGQTRTFEIREFSILSQLRKDDNTEVDGDAETGIFTVFAKNNVTVGNLFHSEIVKGNPTLRNSKLECEQDNTNLGGQINE